MAALRVHPKHTAKQLSLATHGTAKRKTPQNCLAQRRRIPTLRF
jgi:hypothetical protein